MNNVYFFCIYTFLACSKTTFLQQLAFVIIFKFNFVLKKVTNVKINKDKSYMWSTVFFNSFYSSLSQQCKTPFKSNNLTLRHLVLCVTKLTFLLYAKILCSCEIPDICHFSWRTGPKASHRCSLQNCSTVCTDFMLKKMYLPKVTSRIHLALTVPPPAATSPSLQSSPCSSFFPMSIRPCRLIEQHQLLPWWDH